MKIMCSARLVLTAASGTLALSGPAYAAGYGFIGDSITAGYGLPPAPSGNSLITDSFARRIAGNGPYPLIVTVAFNGKSTEDWLPETGLFQYAYNLFNQAGIDTVIITLGVNDSRKPNLYEPERYAANLTRITRALLRPESTVKKISLNCPTYVVPGSFDQWSDHSNTLMQSYALTHEQMVDGTRIILGDRTSYAYMRDTPSARPDGVHPNEEGAEYMGSSWATPFIVPEIGTFWMAICGVGALVNGSYRKTRKI
ncbi:MAG: SGNH/GDSL hydrolase family protein [Fibrella sp.]|nr:SGNH/GDSL hydrolase family protein [Armatimonadota bacterium]